MYSKFFKHTDVKVLEHEVDDFLKELDEITGQIINMRLLQHKEELVVLVIYSCWKKL